MSFLRTCVVCAAACAVACGKVSDGSPSGAAGPVDAADASTEYDALFDVPGTASSPNSLFGRWKGSGVGELRLRLGPDRIDIAQRCVLPLPQKNEDDPSLWGPAVGLSVRARVTPDRIEILETKDVGAGTECAIRTVPKVLTPCPHADAPDSPDTDCFFFRNFATGPVAQELVMWPLFELGSDNSPEPIFDKVSD